MQKSMLPVSLCPLFVVNANDTPSHSDNIHNTRENSFKLPFWIYFLMLFVALFYLI